MTVDREQTRRDDVTEMVRNLVESQRMAADTTERIIDALLIQLEQAERERDEYRERLDEVNVERQRQEVRAIEAERERDEARLERDAGRRMRQEAEARLAKVPALVEALRYYAEYQGPMTYPHRAANEALTVWEQE